MSVDIETDHWIEAGLLELSRGGIDGVRVEVLAERLGVTKGGFYRRFKDRRSLLDAMLQAWTHGRIAAIAKQTENGDDTARARLQSLTRLYTERANAQGMAIELAIRQWAQSDATAATAVTTVDTARLERVTQLYQELGLANAAAEAQAVLFYAFLFGQSLLFIDETPRKRASLLAACARALIDVET